MRRVREKTNFCCLSRFLVALIQGSGSWTDPEMTRLLSSFSDLSITLQRGSLVLTEASSATILGIGAECEELIPVLAAGELDLLQGGPEGVHT